MFDWPVGKEGFVEHMQKWKDAQPITDMSIIEKLGEICDKADRLSGDCSSYEEEVCRAQSALEGASYDIEDDAYGLSDDLSALINGIKNPKEQAEADMEDAE